jgi:hypothetical protein
MLMSWPETKAMSVYVARFAIIFAALWGTTSSALAAAPNLFGAISLRCSFAGGMTTTWPKGAAQTRASKMDQSFVFDSINREKHTARLIADAGASDVWVASSMIGLTFIEMNPAASDVTTVFVQTDLQGRFLAVDTRHALAIDAAMAEQYFGTCTALE